MKLKRLLLTLIILNSAFQIAEAQNWLWAKQPYFKGDSPGGPFGQGRTLAVDKSGNVYETGYFGEASMQYGTDTLIAPGGNDFLSKYDTSGNLQWASAATLPNDVDECTGYSVTTDVNGNVYVTGEFYDKVIIGTTVLTGTAGGEEVFLAKYDPHGNVLWVRQSTPAGISNYRKYGYGVSTDQNGNVYMTGEFLDSIIFGPFTLTCPYSSGYTSDVFLVKYDSTGNPLWAREGALATIYSFATNSSVATDMFNNVYIAGQFRDTVSFGSQQLKDTSLSADIFVVKYDENGNLKWVRQSTNHSAYSFTTDANSVATDRAGSIYVAGSFGDTISFGPITLSDPNPIIYSVFYGDLFLVKYDSSGNVDWAKAGTPQSDISCTGWSVAVDNSDNVYFTATGSNEIEPITPANLTIGIGSQVFTSSGAPSTYISLLAELDTAGNVLCGSAAPVTFSNWVATDPTGQYVYMGGGFLAPVTLGPSTLTLDNNEANQGTTIPFVARWQPCDVMVSNPLSVTAGKTDATCYGLCNGTATATGSGGNPPYSYLWSTQPVDTAQAITGLCAGGYIVTITDNSGSTATSNITITQPVATVTSLKANRDTVCSGDMVTLSATGNTTNLVWQSSPAGINFEDIPDITDSVYSPVVTQTASYRAVAGKSGCFDTSSTIIVVANPLPVSVVNSADSLICFNDSTQVCSSNGFASYSWNIADTSKCITVKQAGDYYVTVTDVNSCSAESNHVAISVYPVPSVSIIQNGDTLSSLGQASYQWLLNGNPISNATGSFYVANGAGAYSVQVTDSNGCTATSNAVAITGVVDLAEEDISLYPNPSFNSWQLTVNSELIGSDLEIYDDNGRLVFQSEIRNLRSEINMNIANGIYWLRISNDRVSAVRKMVRL